MIYKAVFGLVLVGLLVYLFIASGEPREPELLAAGEPAEQGLPAGSALAPLAIEENATPQRADAQPETASPLSGEPIVAGGLTLTFFRPGDEPVTGVRATLIREDARGEARQEDRHSAGSSDSGGRLVWSNLRPGKYRWSLDSSHCLTEIVPPHETEPISILEDGSVQVQEGAPRNLSGVLSIEDMHVELQVGVCARTTVRGQLGEEFGAQARVRLVHRSEHLNGWGEGAIVRAGEHTLTVDEEGRFVFENVRPGVKLVRAVGQQEPQEFTFGSLRFELAEGEDRDLGRIDANVGHSVAGLVRIEGHEGLPDPPTAWLQVYSQTQDRSDAGRAVELIEVVADRPFGLHGLPRGTLRVQAMQGEEGWSPFQKPGMTVHEPARIEHPIPSNLPLEIVFRVSQQAEFPLVVQFPSGVEPTRLEAWFLGESGVSQIDLRVFGNGYDENLHLAEGTYEVLVHSGPIESVCRDSLVFLGELHVRSDAPEALTVKLAAAATIEGELIDSDGNPVADEYVEATFDGWEEAGADRLPFRAPTDAQGKFRLCGLPPNTIVVFSDGSRHRVGGPHTVEQVTLEVDAFR